MRMETVMRQLEKLKKNSVMMEILSRFSQRLYCYLFMMIITLASFDYYSYK